MLSNLKIQILPPKLIQLFYHSFTLHDLLLHFHSITKNKTHFQVTLTYNFSAFLTLDKSRKIIRKKQDEFLAEIIKKIDHQTKLFTSKHPDPKELYKITYTELEKFIELFEARKNQLVYFQQSAAEIERLLKTDDKKKHQNKETIRKMKDTMDDFYEKLCFLLRRYQEKTNVLLLGRLKLKMSRKFYEEAEPTVLRQASETDETPVHSGSPRMLGIYKIQSEYSSQKSFASKANFKRSASKKKTKIMSQFGDVSVQNSKIQKLRRQIISLKTKYQKMNCKTEMDKDQQEQKIKASAMRKKVKKVTTIQTSADSDMDNSKTMTKDQETNASDVKYSIRLTQAKKLSKITSTSFSIFDKKTHHASFILKNGSKFGHEGNIITQDEFQQSHQNLPGEMLRKRSSLLRTLAGNFDGVFPKTAANSVYKPTNFAMEAHQKRVSTAKVAESLHLEEERREYMARKSQTENNIEDDFQQKDEEQFNDEIQETNEDVISIENGKEVCFKEFDNDGDDSEEGHFVKEKDKKANNNRRKGFSKMRIATESEIETNIAVSQSTRSVKRKSQMWTDPIKVEKTYNRTSFFRTSGYVPKKPTVKQAKPRFNNIYKKLIYNSNENRDLSSDGLIDPINTQKTIKTKGLQLDRAKKGMRLNHNAVNAKECKELFDEIQGQCKLDDSGIHPSYFMNMMRQKYDLTYKSQDESDQIDNNGSNPAKKRMMIIETEMDIDENIGKWMGCPEDNDEIRFMRTFARKHNELGQKDLGVCNYSWDEDIE